jgi:6-phosphogluconolactonase
MRHRDMRTYSGPLLLSLVLTTALAAPGANPPAPAKDLPYLVYFGTYTGPVSKGIYVAAFDPATGKLDTPRLAGEITRPSWVTIHPNLRYLYAVSETGYQPGSEGTITSFAIEPATGTLKTLNTVQTGGGGPCHLAIDTKAKALFVANYGSGSVASFRLEPDGRIGSRIDFIQHKGSSTDPKRQRGPHAHAVVLSPDGRFLLVPDLGTDKVLSYPVSSDGHLTNSEPKAVSVKPGSGPRHVAFHPNGRYVYALNEMGSSVVVFVYDSATGELREVQNIRTLAPDFSGENNSAEIAVDRAGRFVYATNRGDDTLTVFAIDGSKGTLTEVQRVSTGGKIPRSFSLDPTGRYLLAANQNSDNIVAFRVDAKNGKLSPTEQVAPVPSPVCIQFLPHASK